MKNTNAICFTSFVILASSFSYWFTDSAPDIEKPWHMQPYVHEDSLSNYYKEHYAIIEEHRAYEFKEIPVFKDSVNPTVFILVDAWGVPKNDSLLKTDFSFFDNNSAKTLAIHKRLANRTKHAERVELWVPDSIGVYLFGGDSLEYNRKSYIPELGFQQALFCQNCSDDIMINKLDSILTSGNVPKRIALTTQSSRDGNRDNLHRTLNAIADLATKHSKIHFIIQGTHRPILGTPETRKMYYPHWVPVIYLNY